MVAVAFVLFAMLAAARAAAPGHLSVMTFYGMDITAQKGWVNVYRGAVGDCDNATLTRDFGMRILVGLAGGIFTRGEREPKNSLYPDWEAATDAFVDVLKPKIEDGTALGVFMGDEICCSGTPYANLSSVAGRLRQGLGPAAWIYTNECSEMASWPSIGVNGTGGVPFGLDAISVDFYDEKNTNGTAEVDKNKKFYREVIFPRLHPHQQALFVPGIFASDPTHCADTGVSCPLDAQAKQIVTKLDGFFQWAKDEARIVGFNPWHFNNRSHPQLKGSYDQRLGAVSMPSVVAKLQEIGTYITRTADRGESGVSFPVSAEPRGLCGNLPAYFVNCVKWGGPSGYCCDERYAEALRSMCAHPAAERACRRIDRNATSFQAARGRGRI